jgi:hypothetical protein
MSDQDDFELRLRGAIQVFAAGADGPVDASQLAATALRTRGGGWLTRPFKGPAQRSPVLATAAIGVAFVAVASFAIALYAGRPSSNIAGPTSTDGPLGSPSPSTSATPQAMRSSPPDYMWPQTSLEEVRQAHYPWQVSPDLWGQVEDHHPGGAQIFPRFLEEVLGWEKFLDGHHVPRQDNVDLDGRDYVYIRCAPGETNPLYSTDPRGAECAPTIDALRYETVKIHVAQPDRQGPYGIWVVTDWEMIGPAVQADARAEQAEASVLLEDFLQARIDGEGAEELADFPNYDEVERIDREIPLLYATSSGAPYQRSEFELVDGPTWPRGGMQFDVRLFAENDETVVEQALSLDRYETGRMQIRYGEQATTENGTAVPEEYSLLDGEVTYRAAAPLMPSTDEYRDVAFEGLVPDDFALLLMLADPTPFAPSCVEAKATDAEGLARIIGSDPKFQTTSPVGVKVGGIPALRMDVVHAPGAANCSWPEGDISESGWLMKFARTEMEDRARLYLIDLPEGSQARVLALVTITDEDSFERVMEAAAPIIDSIEFHAP